jgi:membrane peptidoglycan carboxypeptidase
VTRVEDRDGKVLEEFEAKVPETAMPASVAQTLLDVMRGVIDQGTGRGDTPAAYGCAPTWPARPAPRRTTPTAGSS